MGRLPRAELLRFPKERTSIACLCNRGDADPSNRANQVADILLAGRLSPRETPVTANGAATSSPIDPGLLKAMEGAWQNRTTGDVRIFVTRESKLYPQGGNTALTQIAADRLKYGVATVHYAAGPSASFTLEHESARRRSTLGGSGRERQRGAKDLRRYLVQRGAGWFWRLVPVGDGLRVDIRDRPSGVVRQVGADLFSDGQRHLAFTRSGGKITGFTVAAGRVRGIGFTGVVCDLTRGAPVPP